jgi:hypothetical protein
MLYISEIPVEDRMDRLRHYIALLQSHDADVDQHWFDVLRYDLETVSRLHTRTDFFPDSSKTVRSYHAVLNDLYYKAVEYDFDSIVAYLSYLIFFIEEIRDEESFTDMFNNVSL